MSARDEAIEMIRRICTPHLSAEFYGGILSKQFDAYAHELAEQIRVDAQTRHDRSYSDNRIFELKGARNAADLIDPEVK